MIQCTSAHSKVLFTELKNTVQPCSSTRPLYDSAGPSDAVSLHNSCWCVCLAPLTLINNRRGSAVAFKRLPFHQYESTIKY